MLAMMALVLVAVTAVLAAALYLHLERRYSIWRRKGVPGPTASVSFKIPKVGTFPSFPGKFYPPTVCYYIVNLRENINTRIQLKR